MDNKLLRKLIIPHLAKIFPSLYENRKLICVFTKLATEQFPRQLNLFDAFIIFFVIHLNIILSTPSSPTSCLSFKVSDKNCMDSLFKPA